MSSSLPPHAVCAWTQQRPHRLPATVMQREHTFWEANNLFSRLETKQLSDERAINSGSCSSKRRYFVLSTVRPLERVYCQAFPSDVTPAPRVLMYMVMKSCFPVITWHTQPSARSTHHPVEGPHCSEAIARKLFISHNYYLFVIFSFLSLRVVLYARSQLLLHILYITMLLLPSFFCFIKNNPALLFISFAGQWRHVSKNVKKKKVYI